MKFPPLPPSRICRTWNPTAAMDCGGDRVTGPVYDTDPLATDALLPFLLSPHKSIWGHFKQFPDFLTQPQMYLICTACDLKGKS